MPQAQASIPQKSPAFLLALLLLALLLLTSAGCDAAAATDCTLDTFEVNSFEDINDGVCGAEHCTLREAIEAANSCTLHDPYSIELPTGTYELSLRGPESDRGDLNITRNIAISGDSLASTIIQGESTWNYRIFHVASEASLWLSNLTLAGGNSGEGPGGAIYSQGSIVLYNVLVQENRGVYGAGLFSSGTATLNSVEFWNNQGPTAMDDYLFTPDSFGFRASCGGGIANIGTMLIRDTLVHENGAVLGSGICNGVAGTLSFDIGFVEGNQAYGDDREPRKGGGIFNQGTMSLSNLMIRDNAAVTGGGIYSAAFEGSLSLNQVHVVANEALSYASGLTLEDMGDGGGLFLSGNFQIHTSQIMDNIAEGLGGGLHIRHGAGAITHTSIARNRVGPEFGIGPGRGGGLHIGPPVSGGDASILDFSNVTISSNNAGESGGAAFFIGGTATFINTTIASNAIGREHTSSTAGGIHIQGGSLTFKNSLLSFNHGDCLNNGGFITSQGNNIEMNETCTFTAATDLVNVHVSEVLLIDLSEINGQWVHILIPTGPAVDSINRRRCPEDDQTGNARPVGRRCDVGAYELEADAMSAEVEDLPLIPTPTDESEPAATALRNASCRKGADAAFEIHNFLYEGQTALLIGRMTEGTWYYVELPDELGRCWIFAENLTLVGPFITLPIYTPPKLPIVIENPSGGGEESSSSGTSGGGSSGSGNTGGGNTGGGNTGGGNTGGGNTGGGNTGGGNTGGGNSGGGTAPEAPTKGSIDNWVCNSTDYEVTIGWNDNSDNEEGFRIYRDGQLITTVAANEQQYVDNPPGSGPYLYTIEAFNTYGSSTTTVNEAGCIA